MSIGAKKFNPSFLTDQELISIFCVRTREFESLVNVLRESTGKSNQHQLVIGPRGSGKTSLLLRIAAEIRRNDELSSSFFPLVFAEESDFVASAGSFWLECLFRLQEQAPDSADAARLQRTLDELRVLPDDTAMADRCLGALLDWADREDKRLVLMVENLNALFTDMEDSKAGWRLRKVLQTEPRIILFASATSRFDEIDDPDRAMYDIFGIRTLRPLTTSECAILWETVSGHFPSPERVRSLEILTGGSPRLLVIVARFGSGLSFRNLMDDLLDLIDDHTEYFRSHLESLPAQERRVYVALAVLWKPATAKEVSGYARIEVSKCSAHLKRLISRGVVRTAGGSARRKHYYLTERLYNIYYLLRRGRKSEPLVEALVRFMEAFYSPAELINIGARLVREEPSLMNDAESLPRVALTRLMESPALADQREAFLAMMPEDLVKALEPKLARMRQEVTSEDRAAGDATTKSRTAKRDAIKKLGLDLFHQARNQVEQNQLDDALGSLDSLIARVGKSKESPIPQLVAASMSLKGMVLYRLNRLSDALNEWNELIRRYGKSGDSATALAIAPALVYKGIALRQMDEPKPALEALDKAVSHCSERKLKDVANFLVTAQFERALVLERLDRIDDAISAYEDLDRLYGASKDPTLLEPTARALVNKAVLRWKQSRFEEALKICDETIHRYGNRNEPILVDVTIRTLVCKAAIFHQTNRLKEALDTCDEVVVRSEKIDISAASRSIAISMVDRGVILAEQGKYDDALAAYEKVEARFKDRRDSVHLEATARALVNKTSALHKLDRTEEMLATCDEVVRRYENSENPILLEATARVLINKGAALCNQGLLQEAVDANHQVIRRFAKSKNPALLEQVQGAFLAAAELELARGDPRGAGKIASELLGHYLPDSARKRAIGYVIRAKASFGTGDRPKCEQDISAALELLPELDLIPKAIVEWLIYFCVDLGADRMLELIQQSPSESVLLPLVTALERELGIEPRVAIEVEEVAADIRRKLAKLRKQPDPSEGILTVSP